MSPKLDLDKAMTRGERAVGKAMDRMDSLAGVTSDPDLALYNRLTPEDFKKLETKYGPIEVAEFIREMEVRKMKGGDNGR